MRASIPIKKLEIWLRTRSPKSVKKFYRSFQLMQNPQLSDELNPAVLDDCRMVSSRYELLNHLPKNATVAEMGTFEGKFARHIIEKTAPAELHLIDITFSFFDNSNMAGGKVVRHEGLTHEVMTGFPDNYFDWVYIDADHSYDGAFRDAVAAAPKIKPGGFMVFNDFCHVDPLGSRYGVHRAAVDFTNRFLWPWRYMAYHRKAQYDLALQKPLG